MPVLTLAHSPDADDMVMFWPLTGMRRADGSPMEGESGKPAIDTGEFTFETTPADVEELNRHAIASLGGREESPVETYDITAISAATYPLIAGDYEITSCGASFGEGYGPKVVVPSDSKRVHPEDLRGVRIAVPGVRTTAYLTLSLMLGAGSFESVEMLFSEIPDAVTRGAVDAGLLIHEAQLMLDKHGLREVADVGAWWHDHTGLPLALGLNVVRRDLDTRFGEGTVQRVAKMLQDSIRHAREHAAESRRFLLENAGEREEWKDEGLVEMYLSMYVNEMTVDMGRQGRTALERLFGEASAAGLVPDPGELDIV